MNNESAEAEDMNGSRASEDGRLPVAGGWQCWRQIVRLLRPQWPWLTLTTLLLLVGSAAALLIPLVLGRIVDAVLGGTSLGQLAIDTGVVAGAGVASALLLLWGGRLLVSCLQRALAGLREEVFAAAVRLDQGTVEDAGTSDVVSRVTSDVEAITESVSGVLPRFVQAALTIVLTVAGLAALDLWLALAALIAVPVQAVTTVKFLRRSRPLYRRLRGEESNRGQAIIES